MFGLSKREQEVVASKLVYDATERAMAPLRKEQAADHSMVLALLLLRRADSATEAQATAMATKIREQWYSHYYLNQFQMYGSGFSDGWQCPYAQQVYEELLDLVKVVHTREVAAEAKALGICTGRKK